MNLGLSEDECERLAQTFERPVLQFGVGFSVMLDMFFVA